MKKVKCKKCGYEISENLKVCPFCGHGLGINKVVIIFLVLLFFCVIAFLGNSSVTNSTNSNVSTPKNEELKPSENKKTKGKETSLDEIQEKTEESNPDSRKTYKISTDEYLNFIKSVASNIYENNQDVISSCSFSTYSCAYARIWCYVNKPYEDDFFEQKVYEIEKYIFDELSKNDYKKGSIFVCNYEIVQPTIYNIGKDGRYINEFRDFNVMDLKNYSSFDDYKLR